MGGLKVRVEVFWRSYRLGVTCPHALQTDTYILGTRVHASIYVYPEHFTKVPMYHAFYLIYQVRALLLLIGYTATYSKVVVLRVGHFAISP